MAGTTSSSRILSDRAPRAWLWMLAATLALAVAGPILAFLGRSSVWWLFGFFTSYWSRSNPQQPWGFRAYPLFVAGAFALWCLPLWRGARRAPLYSLIALGAFGMLDAWWLWAGWRYGMEYQGEPFTRATVIANAVNFVILVALGLEKRRRPGFAGNLAVHLLGFVWVGYIAFPYLGESL